MPLDALSQAIAKAMSDCCLRTPNLTEQAIPFHAMPFWFSGEIFQFTSEFQQSILFRVPQGQTGVITGFAVGEHFPGAMAGVRLTLTINGEATPQFPRVAGLLGLGTGYPMRTWIPIPEAAEVGVILDCSWVTSSVSGDTTFLSFGIPWSVSGYYMDKEYFASSIDNSAVPLGPIGSDPINYQNIQIPEYDIATTGSIVTTVQA